MHVLRRWLSPTRVIALTALFFAVGGSAFAVGQKTAAAQPRCATGAVKGIAIVVGDPNRGLANLPTEYTSAANLFLFRFNCAGKAIEIRRVGNTAFDVRFVGTSTRAAYVTAVGSTPGAAAVSGQSDGAWRITLAGPSGGGAYAPRVDVPFIVTVL
jgi:hypothetical protein